MMKACSSKPLMSFIKPGISNSTIHAEALWASFVVEHNLAFNASDHTTKLSQICFLTQKSLNLLLVVASKLLVLIK